MSELTKYREPGANDKVVYTSNAEARSAIGGMPLHDMMPIIRDITTPFEERGIEHTVLGGAALGTKVNITPEYANTRLVTNIIEIVIPQEKKDDAVEALTREWTGEIVPNWTRDDLVNHFWIKYQSPYGGKRHKIPSVLSAEFFSATIGHNTIFLELPLAPAKYYSGYRGGTIMISELKLETYGEVMMHKIIRGNDKDKTDIAQIAVADNNLAELFGPPSVALWVNNAKNMDGEWNRNWMSQHVTPIIELVTSYENNITGETQAIDGNIEVLKGMLRVDAQ